MAVLRPTVFDTTCKNLRANNARVRSTTTTSWNSVRRMGELASQASKPNVWPQWTIRRQSQNISEALPPHDRLHEDSGPDSLEPFAEAIRGMKRRSQRPPKRESLDQRSQAPSAYQLQRFKACLAAPQTTQEHIKQCLRALRPWLVSIPAEQRIAEVQKHQIGGHALNWTWSRKLEETVKFHEDHELIELLCLFLVAEQKHDFILRWMTTSIDQSLRDALGKSDQVWRAGLWRNLVEAELLLTDPTRCCADAAIERFFSIFEIVRSFPEGSEIGKTSPYPALMFLVAAFRSGHLGNTADRQYQRLLGFSKNAKRGQYLRAVLHLYHPTNADPYPALQLLRKLTSDGLRPLAIGVGNVSDLWFGRRGGRSASGWSMITRDLSRTASLLRKRVDEDGAGWAEDMLQKFWDAGASLQTESTVHKVVMYRKDFNRAV